ncbi:MAG TPA: DinB family protein [Vicinamibacteria bacterium]|nr:DinB family protein [Vicinamibacteria bacterium]
MSIAEAMVMEFTHESAGTRKMLERLPDDKLAWKPHQRSMSMGRLGMHLAEIPWWAQTIVKDESFDMASFDRKRVEPDNKKEILDKFDGNVQSFQELLKGQSDEHLFQHWKLTESGHVAVDMPRLVCLRGFVLSHIIHHRGQLSVYLRLNDVPLPALYGPSADENM